MYRLFLLTLALIVYGSLYPWHFDGSGNTHPMAILLASWPAKLDRWVVRDFVLNVFLYAPLGVAAFLLLARHRSRLAAVIGATLFGLAVSLAMELTQAYIPGRVCSLFDVFTNTLGTAGGAILGVLFGPRILAMAMPHARRSGAGAGILLACWTGYQLYPFFPIVSQARLRAAVDLLMHSHTVTGVEIWIFGAEWFAAALAIEVLFGGLPPRWLAVTMLCLPLRAFVPSRVVSFNELAGAALALVLWAVVPPRRRAPAGLAILLTAILAGELAPFQFTRTPVAFSWIPFAASFGSERWGALVILLGKAFEYGAAVWLMARGRRRHLQVGAALAAALFVLELLQCYIPGRTPDITDPLLASLMAFALWAAKSVAAPRAGS